MGVFIVPNVVVRNTRREWSNGSRVEMSCTSSVASRASALSGIAIPAILVRRAVMLIKMHQTQPADDTEGRPADRVARSPRTARG
jgi:hypothetical protein